MTDEPIKSVQESAQEQKTQQGLEALEKLQQQNAAVVDEINATNPTILQTLTPVLVKLRLDLFTAFVLEVFERMGVQDAQLALELRWEELYGESLVKLAEEVRKQKLTEGAGGLVVAKH